ncbi:response regulator, partial [Salmonella enterica subsp. enterica]
LSRRGFAVDVARNRQQALALAEKTRFRYVTLDLHLAAGPAAGVTAPADSGLQLVAPLRAMLPRARILVLTGYASIATAVEAVKLGACHYLAKPSTTDDIEAAFERATGDVDVEVTGRPTSIKTLEWEHIHETLAAT